MTTQIHDYDMHTRPVEGLSPSEIRTALLAAPKSVE